MLPLAAIPDGLIQALVSAGILGPVVWWFMHRFDRHQELETSRQLRFETQLRDREEALSKQLQQRHEEMTRLQDRRHEEVVGAIHDLIRINGIDVMTRPEQTERARRDAADIMKAADQRKSRSHD